MRDFYHPSEPVPLDQADGLRRMFAGRRQCLLPLVSNPFVAFPGVVIEKLAAAAAALGRHMLVVDAAESAEAAQAMARVDMTACIEHLTPDLSYLAARGLPLDYVDTRGTAGAFLDAVGGAAPQADIVLVHAQASELARLFARRAARPILIAADHPEGIKHAYAALKLMAQRASLLTFDLLVVAASSSPRTEHIAASLGDCAERFLGGLLRGWTHVDPAEDPTQPVDDALLQLLRSQLELDDAAGPWPASMPPRQRAALAALAAAA